MDVYGRKDQPRKVVVAFTGNGEGVRMRENDAGSRRARVKRPGDFEDRRTGDSHEREEEEKRTREEDGKGLED